MFAMPAAISDVANSIDFSATVADYAPVINVIKSTWTNESLTDIMNGHVFVPIDTVNEAIAKHIDGESAVKSVTLSVKDNGRLGILADTKQIGRIELYGTLDKFEHNTASSKVVYTIKERELLDHKVMSWIFSRISLSMAEKIVGDIQLGDDLPTDISGNTITVNYKPLLMQTDIAKVDILGCNLINALRIENAVVRDGGIDFETSLNLPDGVKKVLFKLLL